MESTTDTPPVIDTPPATPPATPPVANIPPMYRDVPAYIPEKNELGMPIIGSADIGLGEINLDNLMPHIKEYPIDISDYNVVDDIYSDVDNGYELDTPRLGQVKWL